MVCGHCFSTMVTNYKGLDARIVPSARDIVSIDASIAQLMYTSLFDLPQIFPSGGKTKWWLLHVRDWGVSVISYLISMVPIIDRLNLGLNTLHNLTGMLLLRKAQFTQPWYLTSLPSNPKYCSIQG